MESTESGELYLNNVELDTLDTPDTLIGVVAM